VICRIPVSSHAKGGSRRAAVRNQARHHEAVTGRALQSQPAEILDARHQARVVDPVHHEGVVSRLRGWLPGQLRRCPRRPAGVAHDGCRQAVPTGASYAERPTSSLRWSGPACLKKQALGGPARDHVERQRTFSGFGAGSLYRTQGALPGWVVRPAVRDVRRTWGNEPASGQVGRLASGQVRAKPTHLRATLRCIKGRQTCVGRSRS
jgi:hypothetical protein